MTWVVILDPPQITQSGTATPRSSLDLNTGPLQIGGSSSGIGVDWGDSAITTYEANQTWGQAVVDFRVPNRTVTIPLLLGADSSAAEETVRSQLQQKVALFQREGGWIMRQRGTGPAMYADIVNASLTLADVWGETGDVEPGVVLTLECLPDFYGDEITLDTLAATGCFSSVLTLSGSAAMIVGDHPARARVIVTDTSGHDQKGMIWGARAKHYDPASTAKLFYEAEAMTALNGAGSVSDTACSGGTKVQINTLPAGSWVSVLSTNLAPSGTTALTHQGSYRVWARCCSHNTTPQVRLLWGVGSLAVPVANDPATIPAPDQNSSPSVWYLLDLGEIRLDAPPTGLTEWFGVIQGMTTTSEDLEIDCVYFQPVDEAAGTLAYTASVPASLVSTFNYPVTGVDNSSNGGNQIWQVQNSQPINLSEASAFAQGSPGDVTHYYVAKNFGFNLPLGATISGIGVYFIGDMVDTDDVITDERVRIVKAGSILTTDRASGLAWTQPQTVRFYGGTTDLWGTTWAASDINNAGFGFAIAVNLVDGPFVDQPFGIDGYVLGAYIYAPQIIVYYQLAAGFLVSSDAVMYSSRTAELRWDGMWRNDPSGTVYGPQSAPTGDLVRLPPSGMESRPVQMFVKPSRGDLDSVADSGLDGVSVKVVYRPTYIHRP